MATTKLVLRALTGKLRGQEFAVTGSTHCVLGRSRSCSLWLPGDGSVSRQHCLIEVDKSGAWVQDLGSRNGTHLNGAKISSTAPSHGGNDATMITAPREVLHDGDELRICNNVFAVCLDEFPSQEMSRHNPSSREFTRPRNT